MINQTLSKLKITIIINAITNLEYGNNTHLLKSHKRWRNTFFEITRNKEWTFLL